MSRKVLLVSSTLVIALSLTLALCLTLVKAMPERDPDAGLATVNSVAPYANKTVTGYAQTNEEPPRRVQNARIVAKQWDEIVAETQTNENGDYTLSLDGSAFQICAETTEAISPTGFVAPGLCQAVLFTPMEDTKTANFTFEMPDSQIVGRLLISETGKAPTFPVTITVQKGLNPRPVASQPINPDGTFTVTAPAGTYNVWAIPKDLCYASDDLLLAYGIEVAGTYSLGDHYLSQLGGAVTLGGRVKTPDGQGAPDIGVQAVKLDFTSLTGFLPWPKETTNAAGEFSFCIPSYLAEGTWWLGVALGSADGYLPYPLEWWNTVSISATQNVTDVELLVRQATAHISATLIEEQSGEPATNACGVVVAYKQGEPTVYNARPFAGGTFNLPVLTGTYRLVVIPDPGLPITSYLPEDIPLYPEECVASAGKYLIKTVPSVPVTQSVTANVPITVRVADATIHGRLWDVTKQETVPNVDGQILGWSQGNWSFTRVQTDTGVGDLRASSDSDWLLAYHVDPNSGYRELPGVALASVLTDELTVNLPLWEGLASITGTVLTPNGEPVTAPVAVAAIGLSPAPDISREGLGMTVKPRGDTMVTTDGRFTLTLGFGAYVVTVFGPQELRNEQAWISPEPQLVTLTPADPVKGLELQFRPGDSTLHGHLELVSTSQVAGVEKKVQPPALVWAATAGGHTKTWVDMTENGDYSLPVLQGKRWAIGAAYEVGTSLWITQTVITVAEGATDISLDLTLTPAYSLAAWLVQTIDSSLPFYGELENGTSIEIPVGALPYGQLTLYLQESIVNALAQADFAQIPQNPAQNPTLANLTLASEPPSEGTILQSPAYQVTVVDAMGYIPDEKLNAPMVLNIPYNESALTGYGLSEDDIQAAYFGQEGVGWEAVENYVVDGEKNEVAIFADRLGTYALIATAKVRHEIFLPLVLREVASG